MKIKPLLSFLLGRKVPLRVQHICTYKCNLHCKYCGYWKMKTNELSTEEVKKCMDEFSKAGTISWGFTGGEPLLRGDIPELVNHAKSLGMHVTLLSNGQILDKFVDKIKNIDSIFVSLDGSKKMNDSIRGAGSFDKAVNSIKAAKEAGIDIGIQATLSNKSLLNDCKDLTYIMNLAKDLECKFIISPIYGSSIMKPYEDLLVKDKELFLKGLKTIIRFKKENPRTVIISSAALDWLKSYGNMNMKWKCFAGKFYCQIFPDGKIAPCHFLYPNALDGRMAPIKAFNQLKPIKNCVCWCNCYVEYNLLMAMNKESIFNFMKHFKGIV